MKTAKEMKAITDLNEIKNEKYRNRKAEKIIKKEIYPAIEGASKRGEYKLYFSSYELDSKISKIIKNKLEKLGYIVSAHIAVIQIKWE